ncbi:SIR2 family NAD-dependent protein deacylase [Phytoactinopolyspora mesophila]|uniref:protein acetyllysine N-acetyltransferase n=1 Tax=Phytoactinopolyspora mesophila TaxID=2650750 RepID=A0A7K3M0F0_9ACTN|nr:Sir2 family NAD-dependent protein deacetylase [Phytoactinopolyspora mesophila]NDL56749.1 NAD-dependent deacetylase [Phytoactinopolyspora mesophila]
MEQLTATETARWLAGAERITVLTGAGISTESGVPDFRGPQGVWTKDPSAEALFTIGNYLADRDVRRRSWQARLNHPAWKAKPNAGHHAIADLHRSGRLRGLVTQNIDGLHQLAGVPHEDVIEIHGTMHWVTCLSCDLRTPMPQVLARVEEGDDDPRCLGCGGIRKSATVFFGEMLDHAVLRAAVEVSTDCDVFIAVGTSLSVHPAAGLCDHARAAGAQLVVVNAEPTPYDALATMVIREPISEVLPCLAAAVC